MNDIDIDPAQLRAFADEVADRLDTDFRDRIAEIRALMGDSHFTLGSGRDAGEQFAAGDYSGRAVGFAMGSSIGDGLAWLDEVETGLRALSLASAVFEEKLVTGDVLSAEDLAASAESAPPPSSDRPRGGGDGNERYVI